jgi:hypothetical protein
MLDFELKFRRMKAVQQPLTGNLIENVSEKNRRDYQRPELTVLGRMESLTKGNGTGGDAALSVDSTGPS